MGVEQFSATVRGSGGILATTTQGTVQTDNFSDGGGFEATSSADYPLEVNPAAVMHEWSILVSGPNTTVELTTTAGVTFTLALHGAVGTWDHWDVDKLVIDDPDGATVSGGWAGE